MKGGGIRKLLMAAIFSGVTTMPAAAETADDTVKIARLEILVGNAPGGGFDLFARLLAQHFGRHIAGAPGVTVKNMPGGAGLRLLQHLAFQAPKDGTTVGIFNPALINGAMLEPNEFKVDLQGFGWIGSLSRDTKVCFASAASGVRDSSGAATRGVVLGGTMQGSTALYGSIFRAIGGEKIRLVLGYQSNNDVWLAVDRGEIDGGCTGWGAIPAARPDWISERKVDVLLQFANKPDPSVPPAPIAADLAKSTEMKAAIEFLTFADGFTRPVVTPPGVPGDRLRLLRLAFDEMIADPRFLQNAKAMNIDIYPMKGAALGASVEQILATPAETIATARQISNFR